MISSQELTRWGAGTSTCGSGRRAKTKRRVSGWLSKIKMRRIFLSAPLVDRSRLVFLMTKIFLARLPRCPGREKVRAKFSSSSALGLTNDAGNAIRP